jgi:hypothetical protein
MFLFRFCFSLCSSQDESQDLTLARQVLYHWTTVWLQEPLYCFPSLTLKTSGLQFLS